jgi:hypothetical protein
MIHGVITLLTVSALLRGATRWYPVAPLVLSTLFLVQVVDLISTPVIAGCVLVLLDVALILLGAGSTSASACANSVIRNRPPVPGRQDPHEMPSWGSRSTPPTRSRQGIRILATR